MVDERLAEFWIVRTFLDFSVNWVDGTIFWSDKAQTVCLMVIYS